VNERGAQGERGPQGEAFAGRGVTRSVVTLILVVFVLLGANLLFTAVYVNRSQASQRAGGAALERKLCTSLDRLAALQPPAGNPQANPSRAFEQNQHAILSQLGPDVGCPPVRSKQ
jgi:hypothetical protein